MKEIIFAQPCDINPRLNIKKLKTGYIEYFPKSKTSHLNEIFFTDISQNLLKQLERRGYKYEIKLLEKKFFGPTMNWSVIITTPEIKITLISRVYFTPTTLKTAAQSMCIKIKIEGDKGIIYNLISEYLKYFDHSPYTMTNWPKFEKKIGVKKEECIAAWEKYRQN